MEHRQKIYVAVPDGDLFRAIRKELRGRGYRVQEAMDWGLIPEEVGLFGADVVILSRTLPGQDGVHMVRQLARDIRTSGKPIFAIVGDGEDGHGDLKEAGASEVLSAAMDMRDLSSRIAELFEDEAPDELEISELVLSEVDERDPDDMTDPPGLQVARNIGAGRPLGFEEKGIDSFYEQDIGVFIEVSEALASSLSTEDALYVVVRRISQIIPCRRCNLVLKGVKDDEAFVLASHDDANLRKREIDLGRYPEIRRCLESGEIVLIDDVRKDPEMERVLDFITAVDLRSALVIPLYVREAVVGTVGLTSQREVFGFNRREMLFVRAMANLAAGLLSTSNLLEIVRKDAAAEKPPMEDLSEVVLDLEDQIEGLIEELERK